MPSNLIRTHLQSLPFNQRGSGILYDSKRIFPIVLAACWLLLAACSQEPTSSRSTSFIQLVSDSTGIDFANRIIENDTLNYFTFPYLYLGGGVSVGDINQDGLPDLYFTGNQAPNKLYLNQGNLQFEDITLEAGVAGDDRWYAGATMVDINHDGWLDIYVSVAGKFGSTANQLFVNQGDNTFLEQAEAYGIADPGISIQSTFFDYNNDGYLDLFVANYPLVRVSAGNQYYRDKMDQNRIEDSGHLYKNNGDGTFSDVTEVAGVRRFGLTLGIVASDFNHDGFQDLYLSNDFNVPDYYYQNNGDGTFSEISQQAMPHTAMFGMGIEAADFNNDGLVDLFQLDMTPNDYKRSKTNMASMRPASFYQAIEMGFHHQYMQNVFQLNNGVGPNGYPLFSDISRLAHMSNTDWSWGVLGADFDNDGWKDVFVSNGVKRDVNNNDVNAQYQSHTFFGTQEDRDFRLMPSTPIANYAFFNENGYRFTDKTAEWGLDQAGFSNGCVAADLDRDGDLDLVLNNLDDQASIYANQSQHTGNHYLRLRLNGPETNPLGLGAKVWIKSGEWTQFQELTLTRGYQSSMEPLLHFGLGNYSVVDEIKIVWPDRTTQTLTQIPSDQLLVLDHTDAVKSGPASRINGQKPFQAIAATIGLDVEHQEDLYDDFQLEPLLPHKNSHIGPALAVGDVNQDGLEDVFVGNAAGQKAALYLQDKTGTFTIQEGPWESDSSFEDTGALLFDADGDGDVDLYVVNGGNDPKQPLSFYQDRLYVQTKLGFVKSQNALPPIQTSGGVIIAKDYDGDGDKDLFIGGRIVPGKYPFPAQSHLLRNEGGKDLEVRFTDVTAELAPDLLKAGLVTAALWEDMDQDGKAELVITGEWMPIRFFQFDGRRFREVSDKTGLAQETGWWYGLQQADLDADGDIDLIAGNLGLNYKYQASPEKPFEVYAHDFDENGSMDIVLSYQKSGTQLPLRGRECSSQQVPAIKQRFKTFELFADASLADIYGQHMLDQALHYEANTFAHYWLENKGDGTYQKHLLPLATQVSSVNAIQVIDYNGDPYPDLVIGGNLYQSEPETPRADASLGLVLVGSASGEFEAIPPTQSGLMLTGEVRHICPVKLANGQNAFLFVRNNQSLGVFSFQPAYTIPK